MTAITSLINKVLDSFFSPSETVEDKRSVPGEMTQLDRFQRITGNPYKQMMSGKAVVMEGRAIRRRSPDEVRQLIENRMPGIGDGRVHPSPFDLPKVPKLDALLARDPGLEKQIGVITSRYAGKVEEIKTLIANAKLSLKESKMNASEKQVLQDHLQKLRKQYTFAKIEHRRATAMAADERKRAREEAAKVAAEELE